MSVHIDGQTVGKKNNIIEINGRQYDARTGAVIVQSPHAAAHAAIASAKAGTPVTPAKVKSIANAATKQAELDRVQRQHLKAVHKARKTGTHAKQHAPQPAKTLMRSSVTKPAPSFKTKVKAQAPVQGLIAQPSNSLAHKVAAHAVHPRRNQLAKHVPKSAAISRFGSLGQAESYVAPTSTPVLNTLAPNLQHNVASPAVKPATRHAKPNTDMFQRAINNATSHEQPAHRPATKHRRAKRIAGVSTGILATSLLLATVVTQNMTDIKLQLASAKAGINASLPTERPAGFHTTSMAYDPGSVTVGFASNSDQRSYTINESTSAWDSETLRSNYVAGISKSYQTVQSGGRTIFLTGNGNATWVNGGIWYKIQSNDALSNRQLVDIATSM